MDQKRMSSGDGRSLCVACLVPDKCGTTLDDPSKTRVSYRVLVLRDVCPTGPVTPDTSGRGS